MNLTIYLQDVLPFKEKNHIILEWKDNKWCNIFMDWKIQYYKVLPEWPIDLVPLEILSLIKISM